MNSDSIECPCGQAGHWQLAEHDQFHPPFPPHGKLGDEVPIVVTHDDGTRHAVRNGRMAE